MRDLKNNVWFFRVSIIRKSAYVISCVDKLTRLRISLGYDYFLQLTLQYKVLRIPYNIETILNPPPPPPPQKKRERNKPLPPTYKGGGGGGGIIIVILLL